MHQVYFPEQISTPPTQVILPMGSSVDVILSSMISAGHIFLQSPNEPSFQSLSVLDATMNRSYSEFETPHIAVAVSGMIVAAPIMGGWYRAIVTDVPEPGQVICKFVDYGGYSRLDLSSLRQIRMDFMTLPFQASECYLSDIAPIEGEAPFKLSKKYDELTNNYDF
jgi:A-kinase anchor protein 1